MLAIEAPAKINLYLHVTGRRDDGYHLLDSLIAFASIGDTVEIERDDRLSLAVEGPFGAALASEADNLVLRAALALAAASGVRAGARIRLVKRLPVASGLGGGSADAAAALKGLMALWDLAPGAIELRDLAVALGADVPICLHGRPAFVSGIGERIDPAPDLPEVHLVLANPARPVATEAVFKARRGAFSPVVRFAEAPPDARGLARLLARRRNDLTAPASSIEPAIAETLAALTDLDDCLLVRLCGSGATCFGLFASRETAERGAARLAAAHPAWWVRAARLLGPGEVAEPAHG